VNKRPLSHYLAAMNEWLTCTLLNSLERQVVERMKAAAETSEEAFWEAVEESKLYLAVPLSGVVMKARFQGLCRRWEDLEHA
jgi:hypothetical protein